MTANGSKSACISARSINRVDFYLQLHEDV